MPPSHAHHPAKNITNVDPRLREGVGRKLRSGCHLSRRKRITLPAGRIDSGCRSLPHLKNDAWVNPQTQEPLQVTQTVHKRVAHFSHADFTISAVTETAEFGCNLGPGIVRAESGWMSVGQGQQRKGTASAVSTRTTYIGEAWLASWASCFKRQPPSRGHICEVAFKAVLSWGP